MAKKTRKSIPYGKIQKMWDEGKTYERMGTLLGIKGKEKNDPWKPVRAIVSNMLRGKATAWTDKNGKILTLAPRAGMRAIGVGKKPAKTVKKAAKAVEKFHRSTKRAKVHKHTAKPHAAMKLDGKQLAAGEGKQ